MAQEHDVHNVEILVKQFETRCNGIMLAAIDNAGADQETEKIIEQELAIIDDFCELIRAGMYLVADSEIIQKTIDKAKQDLMSIISKYDPIISGYEDEINRINHDENIFDEENRERRSKCNEKEQELEHTKFFDFKTKRELKIEIEALSPLTPPYDFNEKRNNAKSNLNHAKNEKESYVNKLKGLAVATSDAGRHKAKPNIETKTLKAAQTAIAKTRNR